MLALTLKSKCNKFAVFNLKSCYVPNTSNLKGKQTKCRISAVLFWLFIIWQFLKIPTNKSKITGYDNRCHVLWLGCVRPRPEENKTVQILVCKQNRDKKSTIRPRTRKQMWGFKGHNANSWGTTTIISLLYNELIGETLWTTSAADGLVYAP